MIVLHHRTKKWSYICSEHFSFRHGGSKEEEEKGERKCRRRKHKKKEIKRERLCICIYIKSIISYRYKGPRSGVSQSFMYNSTDSLSLCCDDAPAWHSGSSKSPPCNVACVLVRVRVFVWHFLMLPLMPHLQFSLRSLVMWPSKCAGVAQHEAKLPPAADPPFTYVQLT